MKTGSASSPQIAARVCVNKRKTPFGEFRALQEEEVASNFPYASHTARRTTRPPPRKFFEKKKIRKRIYKKLSRKSLCEQGFPRVDNYCGADGMWGPPLAGAILPSVVVKRIQYPNIPYA